MKKRKNKKGVLKLEKLMKKCEKGRDSPVAMAHKYVYNVYDCGIMSTLPQNKEFWARLFV